MRPDLYHIPRDVPILGASTLPPLSIDLAHDRYPAPPERRELRIDGWIVGAVTLFLASLYSAAYAIGGSFR